MKASLRRTLKDALVSLGAVLLLLVLLLVMNGRVREQVSLRVSARDAGQLAVAGSEMKDLASVVYDVVRDQSSEHATLTIFIVAATVLVVFMVRT
jgi:hypothetical protein